MNSEERLASREMGEAITNGNAAIARVNILGVGVSALNLALAVKTIETWVKTGERNYVCVTGVHGIMESQRDEILRQIHNRAGMVTPDGMPLVWISQVKGHRIVSRVYGPDLLLAVCERSIMTGARHFLFGGAEGVPQRLASVLQSRFPGLHIAGALSPPFRPLTQEEQASTLRKINASKADILWVGLGTPKQERWMAENIQCIDPPVLIGIGAAFDFIAGLKKQAPGWMQRSGLEWLYRLASEPKRLWRRYLINNPLFILMILGQALGWKRYSMD